VLEVISYLTASSYLPDLSNRGVQVSHADYLWLTKNVFTSPM